MALNLEPYLEAVANWPEHGRHILAQFDDDSIVVYQAYRPDIADWAVANQRFGGPWSFNRMSWIKPNFLWMMYRCGWATKTNQERVLAVHLSRSGFEQILDAAVHTSFGASDHASKEEWQAALDQSDVRLQWDPDHDPTGARVERRALQLGLKGHTLATFATDWIRRIEDITEFVIEQRPYRERESWPELLVPEERSVRDLDPSVIQRIGLS